VRRGVLDRAALGGGGLHAAEAEVDDSRAVVDGVDDGGRLVDVGERAIGAAGLHDEETSVAAEARDALAVRDRPGGDRGHEGAVTVPVAHVRRPIHDAVRLGGLGAEIRSAQVGAGVHDRDRDRASGTEDRRGDGVRAGCGPLPLEWRVREGCARGRPWGQSRLSGGHPARDGLDIVDPGA
jgi:hypothetical protein